MDNKCLIEKPESQLNNMGKETGSMNKSKHDHSVSLVQALPPANHEQRVTPEKQTKQTRKSERVIVDLAEADDGQADDGFGAEEESGDNSSGNEENSYNSVDNPVHPIYGTNGRLTEQQFPPGNKLHLTSNEVPEENNPAVFTELNPHETLENLLDNTFTEGNLVGQTQQRTVNALSGGATKYANVINNNFTTGTNTGNLQTVFNPNVMQNQQLQTQQHQPYQFNQQKSGIERRTDQQSQRKRRTQQGKRGEKGVNVNVQEMDGYFGDKGVDKIWLMIEPEKATVGSVKKANSNKKEKPKAKNSTMRESEKQEMQGQKQKSMEGEEQQCEEVEDMEVDIELDKEVPQDLIESQTVKTPLIDRIPLSLLEKLPNPITFVNPFYGKTFTEKEKRAIFEGPIGPHLEVSVSKSPPITIVGGKSNESYASKVSSRRGPKMGSPASN